ncbi:MAG: mechanosensitive ion channel [Deltaproteobacteria bacterium]|nr:mechanosensitive ion channel [Deltaproteobacteria bacterium]MCB9787554.1 mechanosensitive ion channel [Deltaproteobacteria bacterium]
MDTEIIISLLATWGIRIFGVLVLLWVAVRLANAAQAAVARALSKSRLDEMLASFFARATRWMVLLVAILAVLSIFGIETTSVAAVLGAASLAVGLAFQGTLASFAAGVMLLVFRPFKLGDLVSTGGVTGVVKAIDLFTTALDTPDNRRFILPNSTVFGATIENMSHHGFRRVDVTVGVAYDADIDRTREVLDSAAAAIPGRRADLGHQIFLESLGDSAVVWQVRVWADVAVYWDVWQATTRAAKRALDDAGISIPFPQLDVHLAKDLDQS